MESKEVASLDDFEVVDFETEFKKLQNPGDLKMETIYSIGKMHPIMHIEHQENHPASRKPDEHMIQVLCDEEPQKNSGTYYYSFEIKDGKNTYKITKRFNNFKDYRQQLKEAFFMGEEKIKLTDGDSTGMFEGYLVIPMLDESITPTTLEQAKERMQHLRLFLLKTLCNNSLLTCKITQDFIKLGTSQPQGYVSDLKGKAGRWISMAYDKLHEGPEQLKNLLKGEGSVYVVDPELQRFKDSVHLLQQNIVCYKNMLEVAGGELRPEVLSSDVYICIAFARDAELQIESIIDAEKTVKVKEGLLQSCRQRKEKSRDLQRDVDVTLIKNIEIWLHNTRAVLRAEKEAIIKTLKEDMDALENIVIKLMIKITEFNRDDGTTAK